MVEWSRARLPTRELPALRADARPFGASHASGALGPLPDETDRTAYFAPDELVLKDFSLTLRQVASADGTRAVTGATACLEIGIHFALDKGDWYAPAEPWRATLAHDPRGGRPWAFQPLPHFGLSVAIELPPGTAVSEPAIRTSRLSGTALISIELSAAAARAWQAALLEQAGHSLPGTVRARVSHLHFREAHLQAQSGVLDTPLGKLLGQRGVADIRYVDADKSIRGRVAVIGCELVDETHLMLRPDVGQETRGKLAPGGGYLEASVEGQNPETLHFDWAAQVQFGVPGWPDVSVRGRLDRGNGWVEVLKPESWLTGYTFVALAVNTAGVVEPKAEGGVQIAVTHTRPGADPPSMRSVFYASYFRPLEMLAPCDPTQTPGPLAVSIFRTSNHSQSQLDRTMRVDESAMVILVGPDGTLSAFTSADPASQAPAAIETLQCLAFR